MASVIARWGEPAQKNRRPRRRAVVVMAPGIEQVREKFQSCEQLCHEGRKVASAIRQGGFRRQIDDEPTFYPVG